LKADIDAGTDAFDDIWNLSKGDLLSYVLLHRKQSSLIYSRHCLRTIFSADGHQESV
jgi:hypothetical protein